MTTGPVCSRTPTGLRFTWPDTPIQVAFTRLQEGARGLPAEIEVRIANGRGTKLLHHETISLLSQPDHIIKRLGTKAPGHNWLTYLEHARTLAIQEIRQGEPIQSLDPTNTTHPAWFVCNPLLYQGHLNILYGPGGSMKSLYALYIAMCLSSGVSGVHAAVSPEPWRVLYLDWEMSHDDMTARVAQIRRGTPSLTTAPDYRRCWRALWDELDVIKLHMAERGYDILVMDSLAMAAGGQDLEKASAPIHFQQAVRALNCTVLCVAHTPGESAEQEGKSRKLYGSVFFQNLARNVWEMRREGDEGYVGLFHKKTNFAPHAPLAMKVTVSEEVATFEEASLDDEPALTVVLPLHHQLERELRRQPGQTWKELAEVLQAKPSSVKGTLYRYKKLFVSIGAERWVVVGS